MRRYRVLLPLLVHTKDASYGQGEEFEKEFSAEDEAENLASGLLELVPSWYRVCGTSNVFENKPGSRFQAAIPLAQEALLVQGGHIERAPLPPKGK